MTGVCAPIQWVALSGHLMADPAWAIDEDDAQAVADEIVSQLARGVKLGYRLLSVAAANMASVPASTRRW